ncbi:MAG: transglutaminase domain-containing protein [Methanotrichaceae archaeon]|nr:transglutaminase domain-containing protein [Methanotrichaceae archaeon]
MRCIPIVPLIISLLFMNLAGADEIPFVFGNESLDVASLDPSEIEELMSSSELLAGVPPIVALDENATIEVAAPAGPGARGATRTILLRDIKAEINSKIDVDNPITRKKAVIIAADYPGDHTIDQICSIYEYLKGGWHYVPDPRGIDYFFPASESLDIGEQANCAGAGDCDDFAILMATLIESIGGTTRIVLADNVSGAHAYAEVYLGTLDAADHTVKEVVDWLREHYATENIFVHINSDNKDVWLNLDWSADNPGGPFYRAEGHVILSIRDQYGKTPLQLPAEPRPAAKRVTNTAENSPPQIISLLPDLPSPQEEGTPVTWRVSAVDEEGDSLQFRFLHSGPGADWVDKTGWTDSDSWVWTSTENDVGINEVKVFVRDGPDPIHGDYDDSKKAMFIITYPMNPGGSSSSSSSSRSMSSGSTRISGGSFSSSSMSSGSMSISTGF